MDKKAMLLTEEELELVTGGNQEETQEFCNAFLNFAERSGNISKDDIANMRKLPLEELAKKVTELSKNGQFGGIVANLYTDGRPNDYYFIGISMSHKDAMNCYK